MKVHVHTKFCFLCLLTFIFHHCNHCHGYVHDHTSEESHTHRHNDYQISEEPYLQSGSPEHSTSRSSPADAEHEQKYYIEKLFHRYGENGKLSYYGLEKLLSSLGLGEVKVVEIGHKDVGHDHVSHLDALHDHDAVDSHPHTDEKNESKTVPKCKEKKTSVPPEHKSTHKHHMHHHRVHNSTNHPRNHSHHNHTVSHVSLEEQTNEPLPGTNTTQEQAGKEHHKLKKRRKGNKTGEMALDAQFEFEQTPDENKNGYKSDHNSAASHTPANGDDDHHEAEEHRERSTRKREAPSDHTSMKGHVGLQRRHGQHDDEPNEHDECLNVTQLLSYYGLNINSPISPKQFAYMCPALLYQIDSRLCIRHFTGLEMTLEESKVGASAWICGLISITVISLLSLLGVILIPIINQGCFKFLLNFLVALAVGTLSGDALLHLLPHSQGGHDHGSEHGHSHDHGTDMDDGSSKEFLVEYDSVMKGLVALGGIYLLFIVEHCLRMFKHYKERRERPNRLKRKQKSEESAVGRKLSDHKLNRRSDAEWLQLKPLAAPEDPAASESQQLNETEMTYVDSLHQSPVKVFVPPEDAMPHINKDGSCDDDHSADDGQFDNHHAKVEKPKKHSHSKHSHHSHGHCHSGKDMKDTGIASIAWMVIMGDGMHNFSDGLAIGAAFSAGLTGGISTSVAVFCHELPHELGDFAVLLKAGMTVKQAIVYNLLSAMMAYVGMLIGTAVGQYANNITLWIFAITAGMFLYVALVDMLPEMLHGDGENEEHSYCQFILQNLGLLLGFAIMLVIALYEDKIVFDLNF